MKRKLIVVLGTVFMLISGWVSAQDFILNNPTMNPNPATYPGGKETITFSFATTSAFTFSSNSASNNFAVITFSFTKLDPTGIAPTGTGAALFNWTLTSSGSGSSTVYTYTGTTQNVTMNAIPTNYSISFDNVPVTAAATQAQTDIRVAGTFTDPAAAPTGQTANNSASIATYSTAPLPVNFGYTNAHFSNGKLSVEWSSLTETNNKSFVVEVSKDGKQFKAIDSVVTKAVGGNSKEEIKYTYTKDLAQVVAALGYSQLQMAVIALLAVAAIVSMARARKGVALLSFILLVAMGIGCRKNDNNQKDKNYPEAFVRVKQINIDGTVGDISKVVKVIVE